MQISVSSTLTLFHDGHFWVGIVEHVEDDSLGAARDHLQRGALG